MQPRSTIAILFAFSGFLADANAQSMSPPSRGEMLYTTYCIACHNEQIHWRDKRIARNFKSLHDEVNRWQKLSTLKWSNEDIEAVAQYLNTLHYHFPSPY